MQSALGGKRLWFGARAMHAVPIAPTKGSITPSEVSVVRDMRGFMTKTTLSARMLAKKNTRGLTTRNSGSAVRRLKTWSDNADHTKTSVSPTAAYIEQSAEALGRCAMVLPYAELRFFTANNSILPDQAAKARHQPNRAMPLIRHYVKLAPLRR